MTQGRDPLADYWRANIDTSDGFNDRWGETMRQQLELTRMTYRSSDPPRVKGSKRRDADDI